MRSGRCAACLHSSICMFYMTSCQPNCNTGWLHGRRTLWPELANLAPFLARGGGGPNKPHRPNGPLCGSRSAK
eukprot:15035773-Alexandrium_andersonii.AAC.1